MEYKNYVVKKRARFAGVCGDVNIPYGTNIGVCGDFLVFNGNPICTVRSQNALDYFAQNDDGCGEERGKLTIAIMSSLAKRDKKYDTKWDKIIDDELCQKYRRKDHEDHWLWNKDFFDAPISDLQYIENLIKI